MSISILSGSENSVPLSVNITSNNRLNSLIPIISLRLLKTSETYLDYL